VVDAVNQQIEELPAVDALDLGGSSLVGVGNFDTAATANSVAQRTSDGRLKAAAATEADDLTRLDQTVTLSGNQNIAGVKTFSEIVTDAAINVTTATFGGGGAYVPTVLIRRNVAAGTNNAGSIFGVNQQGNAFPVIGYSASPSVNGLFIGADQTQGANGATSISFSTASAPNVTGAERMRITSSGNVGIGTSNVYGNLHLYGAQQDIVLTNQDADGVAGTTIARIISQARGYGNNGAEMASIDFETNATSWFKGDIVFKTNNSDGSDPAVNATERMRITSSGNVMIGTTEVSNFPVSTTQGIDIGANYVSISRSNASLFIQRSSTDGDLAQFYKDTAQVGSIGSYPGGLLYTTAGLSVSTGIVYGDDLFVPCGAGGAARDNIIPLGSAGRRWSVVYAGTGSINTSDAREKTPVDEFTADELNAAKQLSKEIGTYKFLSAVAKKGDDARKHVGMTVQRAIEIMEANNLDPFAYGFICYDEWEEQTVDHPAVEAKEAVLDEEGNVIEEAVEARAAYTEVTQEAGNRYSFRPDEMLFFIARGLEARIEALEG
jgi:hypothetical protein